MDNHEHGNGASGNIPEFGAIFLSNTQTKKECLQRNIFALPSSHAEFVRHVKEGMVLFLFETRKRQLFGVYQASSDGAVDINPHAFSSSGRHFPAQVRFRQIWHCGPISEKEFQDAIIGNYFCARKFNFGLSKDQVHRLLYLFSSKKIKRSIPSQPQSEAIVEVSKDRRLVGDDRERHGLSETGYMESTEYDDHVSSLAKGKEVNVLVENRANADGKNILFSHDDFIAKRRRIGKEYPEHFLDPLDARVRDDYTSLQRSTLREDYDILNGRQRTFASDNYGSSLAQGKRVIDDDRFLLDDSVIRDCDSNVVRSVSISDHNMKLCRQERGMVKDYERLMGRKSENAFDPSTSHLHKIRKTNAAGRFQIDKNEPRLGTCFAGGLSSKTDLPPWHCGYRIIEGRKYPVLEGMSTENMVDKGPPALATKDGNVADEDRQVLVNARYRKSERVDSIEASHTHSNHVISMKYPFFSKPEQNLSSFPVKFPNKQLSQFTVSNNFDISPSILEDAAITKTIPYSPDHPSLSHGCSSSKEASQYSTSMQKNHAPDGSLGNFYPLSSNRLHPYPLETEKSIIPQDATLEYGDNGFAMSTPGLRSSLLRESSSSFVKPDLSVYMDLNTSAPINYRGSLSSKLSPPCTDPENFEGKKGLFAYYSKSQDLGMDICQREKSVAIYGNQHFRISRNMNPMELHISSGANSTLNRRSVFTRLSSKSSQFSEKRNDIDVNIQDCYVNATADELMEMLKQNDNLSPRRLGKSGVVGQQARESAVAENKTQYHMETEHSTMEMEMLSDATQATADSSDEIPKETRALDFKRRSERKLVGISGSASHSNPMCAKEEVKSSTNSTSRRKKLVRPAFSKTETAVDAATCINETLQPSAPVLNEDDKQSSETTTSLLEPETPINDTRTSNVLAPHTLQEGDCNKEPPCPKEQ
ncbi:uncharacterized protein LOC121774736 isoform X2 [Salvia splendens]|nr:uncharacterized protein LOC121774736 isoform X2 [Salvia splendens]XP_042027547.1 uncharacterized protein LOC121774736 isoform X2 [Salvia splendens]XP_042027548.1 uncharacterized protein LOC121774736 isoform X2 [Salvia splendens]